MDRRRLFFKEVLQLSDQHVLDELEKSSMYHEWEKGDVAVNIGDTVNSLNFLVHGLFRGYYIDSKGQEVTDCFGNIPGAPIISVFDLAQPSPICLELLEKSVSIAVPMNVIQMLLYSSCEAQRVYNRLLQESLQMHWEIKRALSQYTAEERYEWFLECYPGIIERINHKYVASFLGITPVSLSRVRKKYKSREQID